MKLELKEKIGDKGGFGTVYRCISDSGDVYAIKILDTDDDPTVMRFQKEIRLTARLSHPNVIKIVVYDTSGKQKFYVMPLYQCSLAKVIPDVYGSIERQYRIITEVLNGVSYLHSEGVLHRDLKPQNILFNSDSDIVISDLGFSRQVDSDSSRLTQVGDFFGTYRYVSPEQLNDSSTVTEKTDIYALGKIIEDIGSCFLSNPVQPNELEYVITRCTYQNPNRRFESVSDMKIVIDSIYQKYLGIVEYTDIDNLLNRLKIEELTIDQIIDLGLKLFNYKDGEKIEEYFFSIPSGAYQHFEEVDSELLMSLIILLRDYFISQGWGFGYTDKIGNNCRRLYELSNNATIKANLLYTIIEVGISHNRWHVMGIAASLLQNIYGDPIVSLELSELFKQIRELELSRLNINKEQLMDSLKPFYE